MEIRVHEDTGTIEAISDSIKLNLGDIFEKRDDIPSEVTFEMLYDDNESFRDWITEIIKGQLFMSKRRGEDEELKPFSGSDIQAVVIEDGFLEELFSVINDITKKEFVDYRHNLIEESQKDKPNFVAV